MTEDAMNAQEFTKAIDSMLDGHRMPADVSGDAAADLRVVAGLLALRETQDPPTAPWKAARTHLNGHKLGLADRLRGAIVGPFSGRRSAHGEQTSGSGEAVRSPVQRRELLLEGMLVVALAVVAWLAWSGIQSADDPVVDNEPVPLIVSDPDRETEASETPLVVGSPNPDRLGGTPATPADVEHVGTSSAPPPDSNERVRATSLPDGSATTVPAYPPPATHTSVPPATPSGEASVEPTEDPPEATVAATHTPHQSPDTTLPPPTATAPDPRATQLQPPVIETPTPMPSSSPTWDWPSPVPTVTIPPTPPGGIPTSEPTDVPAPIPTRTSRVPSPTPLARAIPARGTGREIRSSSTHADAVHAGASASDPIEPGVWQAEWGGFHGVYDLAIVSETEMWAASTGLARYDGGAWRAVDARQDPLTVSGIDLAGDGSGWAVGYQPGDAVNGGAADIGVAVRMEAGGPVYSMDVPGFGLKEVAVGSGGTGWAIARPVEGWRDVVLRLDDDGWTEAWEAPTGVVWLSGITMFGDDDGWIVGSEGFLARFDGETWREVYSPTHVDLTAVEGRGSDDVWALGGFERSFGGGESARVAVRFDGQRWRTVIDDAGAGFIDLSLDADAGYAVDVDGSIFELDGGTWRATELRVPTLWGQRPGAIALVPGGGAVIGTEGGEIYRLDDGELVKQRDGVALTSIAVLDSGEGWTLGRMPLMKGPDGWAPIPADWEIHAARDVAKGPTGEVWAVGRDGLVLRNEPRGESAAGESRLGQWTRDRFPTNADLRLVEVAEDSVWAIGAEAIDDVEHDVVYRRAASGWERVWAVPGGLNDIAVLSRDQAWIAAGRNGIWNFDGSAWLKVSDLSARHIEMLSPLLGWAASGSRIYAFDDGAWRKSFELPAGAGIHALEVANGIGWAATTYGLVAHFDGSDWTIVRGSENTNRLYSVPYALEDIDWTTDSDGERTVWTVGGPSMVLRAAESDVREQESITPDPTTSPPAPTPTSASPPTAEATDAPPEPYRVYLPAVLLRPATKAPECLNIDGASADQVADVATLTAEAYWAGGTEPQPERLNLELMTVAEVDRRFDLDLAGRTVGTVTLHPDRCVWWTQMAGRFDCRCGATHEWQRMDIGLLPEDAKVFFVQFRVPRAHDDSDATR